MTELINQHRTLLDQGISLFNAQRYYECHEVLEQLWKEQDEPHRQFTQGLIQAAVATHHLIKKNKSGATKLYKKAIARLKHFLPVYDDVDVLQLVTQCELLLEEANLRNSQTNQFVLPSIQRVH